MIIDKIGDILHTEADVICHQVNCKGVMGAGLAKQIRNQLLSEEQYRTYQEICREYGRANLGKVIRYFISLNLQFCLHLGGNGTVNIFTSILHTDNSQCSHRDDRNRKNPNQYPCLHGC